MSVLSILAAAPCRGDADEAQSAREHYRRGTNAFNLGHYLEAVKEYEAAYQIKDEPALLFNIAQAYRLAGEKEAAVRVYKSFLHQVPDSEQRPDVEKRIAEMEQLIERERRAKAAPPEGTLTPHPPLPNNPPPPAAATGPAPAPPREPWYRDTPALALGCVGAAAIGVGIGLVVKGALDLSHASSAVDLQIHDNLRSSGITFEAVGYSALGVGAALAIAGIVKHAVWPRRRTVAFAPVRLHATAFGLGGSF